MPFYGRDINTGHPETYADLLKLLVKQIPDKNKRDATDLIGRLRRYLADDLDTPKALAAVDGWVADAEEFGGHDTGAPALVAAASDALLGVPL